MTITRNESARPPRTWLITGATSGIGQATAAAALQRGDKVAAIGRNLGALDALASQHGESILVLAADVRDEAAVNAAAQATVNTFGGIDVVVTNAAYGIFGGIEEITAEQWRGIFDTNFFGTTNTLRATLPVLRKQKSGHILIGSAHYGQSAHSGVGSVAATKHALEGITDALADEVTPLGIKVTTFEPGFTATQFLARLDMGGSPSTDYDQTVRATFAAVGQMPPEAFNSAEAVAAALLTVVDSAQPPRRLATGSASLKLVKDSLEARLKDLNDWAEVTTAVDNHSLAGNAS